jgi:hypothetical protein
LIQVPVFLSFLATPQHSSTLLPVLKSFLGKPMIHELRQPDACWKIATLHGRSAGCIPAISRLYPNCPGPGDFDTDEFAKAVDLT